MNSIQRMFSSFCKSSDDRLVREVVEAISNKEEIERIIAHIMMVGFPGTGKTSLVDRLLGISRKVYTSTGVCGSVVVVDVSFNDPTSLKAAVVLNFEDSTWQRVECKDSFLIQLQKCTELAHQQSTGLDELAEQTTSLIPQKDSSLIPGMLEQAVSSVLKNHKYKSLSDIKGSCSIYMRDTGGQVEFQEILTILINGPSIFFVVFNASIPINEPLTINYRNGAGEILNEYSSSISTRQALIQNLASISAMQTSESVTIDMHKPLVFIVGTHIDQLGADADNKIAAINKNLDELITQNGFDCLVEYENVRAKRVIFTVDNKSPDDTNFKKIRSRVNKVITENKSFSIKYPVSYLLFCLELQDISKSVLTREEFDKIAATYGIRGDKDVKCLLHFLHHRIGIIRYYDVDGLRHLVVKEPQVLFNKLTELIVKTFPSSHALSLDEGKEFKKGILEASVFERILSTKDEMTAGEFRRILEHLHIIVPFKDKKGIMKLFIPAVLNHVAEMAEEDMRTDIPPLAVAFKCHHCPKGLFGMLVAHLMVRDGSTKEDKDRTFNLQLLDEEIFKDQVSFAIRMNGDCDKVSLKMHPSHLEAKFYPEQIEEGEVRSTMLPIVCNALRQIIKESIDRALTELQYNAEKVDPVISSKCPKCLIFHQVEMAQSGPCIRCPQEITKKLYLPAGSSFWHKTSKGTSSV